MPRKTYITHPKTQETLCLSGWANKLGIKESTFKRWVRNYPLETVFDNNFEIVATKRVWKNPATGESFTSHQWAEILNITTGGFLHRICRLGVDNPKTFIQNPATCDLKGYSAMHLVADKNKVNFCTNLRTGESLLACEWAKRYGVPLIEFYQAMKRFGRNSPGLYQYFEGRKSA